jgi:hypothetical protein
MLQPYKYMHHSMKYSYYYTITQAINEHDQFKVGMRQ